MPDTCQTLETHGARPTSEAMPQGRDNQALVAESNSMPFTNQRPLCSSDSSLFMGHPKYGIGQPATEGLVVLELLEELGVVFKHRRHNAAQRLIVLQTGI